MVKTKPVVTTLTLPELEARRRALALDAREGHAGAAAELDAIEKAIDAARREAERATLAEEEHQARAATDAAAEHAAREAADRTALEAFEVIEAPVLAADADARVTDALLALDRLRERGRQADQLRTRLGLPTRMRRDAVTIAGAVAWRLSDVLGRTVRRPHLAYRQPLAVLFEPRSAAATEETSR